MPDATCRTPPRGPPHADQDQVLKELASGSGAPTPGGGCCPDPDDVEWPRARCGECGFIARWNKMRSVKEYTHLQMKGTDADDKSHWVYTCVPCRAKQLGVSEKDAHASIIEERSVPNYARQRNVRFKEAFRECKEEHPAMSRGEVRMLTQRELAQVLEPLGEFIARKLKQLVARQRGIEEYDALLAEFRNTKSKTRELALLEELEAWEPQLEALCMPLAFAAHGEDEQHKMVNVAQYSDEWVNTKNGSLRAWYVCLQDWGENYPCCGTVMPAKQWSKRYTDIAATHQRWYCVICDTRYWTKYGMLVEVHANGVSTFMLAETSNQDVEDVRAMYMEQELKPKNHVDLWELIPDFVPIDPRDVLRPLEANEPIHPRASGSCDPVTISKFINAEGLKNLPRWTWDQIFAIMDPAE